MMKAGQHIYRNMHLPTTSFCVYVDSKNHIWFGTLAGVTKYEGDNWESYTSANGLVYNQVNSIAEDNEGNMWFGTLYGASMFDGSTFKNYTTENGLPSNYVTGIGIDNAGNVWIGTLGGGVARLKKN